MYKLASRQIIDPQSAIRQEGRRFMNNRTRIAVERQVAAMGAEVFEVGLFKPRVPGDGSNEPEMLPRVWDRDTLLRSVGWLCFQNTQGRNIYVRPKGEHHLSLVDDLTAE